MQDSLFHHTALYGESEDPFQTINAHHHSLNDDMYCPTMTRFKEEQNIENHKASQTHHLPSSNLPSLPPSFQQDQLNNSYVILWECPAIKTPAILITVHFPIQQNYFATIYTLDYLNVNLTSLTFLISSSDDINRLRLGLFHKTRGGRNTFGMICEDAMVRVTKGVGKRLQLRVEFTPDQQRLMIQGMSHSTGSGALSNSMPDHSVPFIWDRFTIVLEELSNATAEVFCESPAELDSGVLLVRPPKSDFSNPLLPRPTEDGEMVTDSIENWEEVTSPFVVDDRSIIVQCELKLFHLTKTLRFRVEYSAPNVSFCGYSYMFYTHDSGKSKKIAFGNTAPKTSETIDSVSSSVPYPSSKAAKPTGTVIPSNTNQNGVISSSADKSLLASVQSPDSFEGVCSPQGATPSFTPSITSDYDESSAESPHHYPTSQFDHAAYYEFGQEPSFQFHGDKAALDSSESSCSSSSGITPSDYHDSHMDYQPTFSHAATQFQVQPSSSSSLSSDDGVNMMVQKHAVSQKQHRNDLKTVTAGKQTSGKSSNRSSHRSNGIKSDILDDAILNQKLAGKGPNKRKKRKIDQITPSSQPNSEYPYTVAGSLDVQGVVRAQSFVQFSDIRFKTNVEDLTDALKIVSQLRGKKYEWKDSINGNPSAQSLTGGRKVIGLIAQEVKRVLPECVVSDDNGFLSLNYTDMVPLLIEALKQHVQDSAADSTSMKEEISELRAKVDELSIRSGGDSCTETSSYMDDISDLDDDEYDLNEAAFEEDESESFQDDPWEIASSGSNSERTKSTNLSGIVPRGRAQTGADGGSLSRSGSPLPFRRNVPPSPSSTNKARGLHRVPSYSSAGSGEASLEMELDESSNDDPRFLIEDSLLTCSSASLPDAPVDASCESLSQSTAATATSDELPFPAVVKKSRPKATDPAISSSMQRLSKVKSDSTNAPTGQLLGPPSHRRVSRRNSATQTHSTLGVTLIAAITHRKLKNQSLTPTITADTPTNNAPLSLTILPISPSQAGPQSPTSAPATPTFSNHTMSMIQSFFSSFSKSSQHQESPIETCTIESVPPASSSPGSGTLPRKRKEHDRSTSATNEQSLSSSTGSLSSSSNSNPPPEDSTPNKKTATQRVSKSFINLLHHIQTSASSAVNSFTSSSTSPNEQIPEIAPSPGSLSPSPSSSSVVTTNTFTPTPSPTSASSSAVSIAPPGDFSSAGPIVNFSGIPMNGRVLPLNTPNALSITAATSEVKAQVLSPGFTRPSTFIKEPTGASNPPIVWQRKRSVGRAVVIAISAWHLWSSGDNEKLFGEDEGEFRHSLIITGKAVSQIEATFPECAIIHTLSVDMRGTVQVTVEDILTEITKRRVPDGNPMVPQTATPASSNTTLAPNTTSTTTTAVKLPSSAEDSKPRLVHSTGTIQAQLEQADLVWFVGHSQGVQACIHTCERLLRVGTLSSNEQVITVLSLGGIHHHCSLTLVSLHSNPIIHSYLPNFGNHKKAYKEYKSALTKVLEVGVTITTIGAYQDALVNMTSSSLDYVRHPNILRGLLVHNEYKGQFDPRQTFKKASNFVQEMTRFAFEMKNKNKSIDFLPFLNNNDTSVDPQEMNTWLSQAKSFPREKLHHLLFSPHIEFPATVPGFYYALGATMSMFNSRAFRFHKTTRQIREGIQRHREVPCVQDVYRLSLDWVISKSIGIAPTTTTSGNTQNPPQAPKKSYSSLLAAAGKFALKKTAASPLPPPSSSNTTTTPPQTQQSQQSQQSQPQSQQPHHNSVVIGLIPSYKEGSNGFAYDFAEQVQSLGACSKAETARLQSAFRYWKPETAKEIIMQKLVSRSLGWTISDSPLAQYVDNFTQQSSPADYYDSDESSSSSTPVSHPTAISSGSNAPSSPGTTTVATTSSSSPKLSRPSTEKNTSSSQSNLDH